MKEPKLSHRNYIIRYEGECNGALVVADVLCKAEIAPQFLAVDGIGVALTLKSLLRQEDERDPEPGELWLHEYDRDRVNKIIDDTLQEMRDKLKKNTFKNGIQKRDCKKILVDNEHQKKWKESVTERLLTGADGHPQVTLERMPVPVKKKMEVVS